MANLRSKTKAKTMASKALPKTEPTAQTASTPLEDADLCESTLRKLPRAQLQKLAMAHKVKANMKSELIIQQLSSLQIPKKKRRHAEDDVEEGPSRKRLKREDMSEEIAISHAPESRAAPLVPPLVKDASVQTSVEDHIDPQQETEASIPRSTSAAYEEPRRLSYDGDVFSGTESEMTEEEQLDFATPISSRSGTPPPANVKDLERCVKIMQEISAEDITLLKEVMSVRETAARLRKRARDVRELVKAETGRRERMEAYVRYWQEMDSKWDRRWLYGEQMESDSEIRQEESDEPTGPPTIPNNQNLGGNARRPILTTEEVKKRREEIVSKQEAEQRQLERDARVP